MTWVCACGHRPDEHGDPDNPKSIACNVVGCGCGADSWHWSEMLLPLFLFVLAMGLAIVVFE